MVTLQYSQTSPSKSKCSSPSRNLMSCSLSTPWFYSNYPSYGNVIRGISYLCSLNYFSCGNVIYGTIVICLIAYTIVGTAFTNVGTISGSTLPFIIFCAFKFVLSYSLFTPKHEALPSSIMFFLLITLLGEFATIFFFVFQLCFHLLLVFLTLAKGLYGSSF